MTTRLTCASCRHLLEESEFHAAPRNTGRRGRNSYCKKCASEKAFISNNRKYGISVDEYDDLYSKQDGACAIRGKDNSGKRLCVDHCHSTGNIRGLLCHRCNVGIGMFLDNTELLASAILYLTEPHG